MANKQHKIIRILQRGIYAQSKLAMVMSSIQMEMHQTFFDVCNFNDRLIKENADLRRKLEKHKK